MHRPETSTPREIVILSGAKDLLLARAEAPSVHGTPLQQVRSDIVILSTAKDLLLASAAGASGRGGQS